MKYSLDILTQLPWWVRWWSVCLQCGRAGFNPWVGKISWRREWQPTPVFLVKAMESHSSTLAWKIPRTEDAGGLQSMGSLELDMTERLHFAWNIPLVSLLFLKRSVVFPILLFSSISLHWFSLIIFYHWFLYLSSWEILVCTFLLKAILFCQLC